MANAEKHPIDAQIGAYLRSLRKDSGLSQIELAKTLGVSYQQLQKYETGQNRLSASRLHQVAQIFEISVAKMFGEEAQSKQDCEIDRLLQFARTVEGKTLNKSFMKIESKKARVGIIEMIKSLL